MCIIEFSSAVALHFRHLGMQRQASPFLVQTLVPSEGCRPQPMDAAWRRDLAAVLHPATLAHLEAELAEEAAAEAEDAPPFVLFGEEAGESDGDGVTAVSAALAQEPGLGLCVEDVPLPFRSKLWFKVLRPGGKAVPVVEGKSQRGHGDVIWAAAEYSAEALVDGAIAGLVGPLPGRRVLEVGAGVGLPSCAALRCGADVVASDLPDLWRLLALASSLALNQKVGGADHGPKGRAQVVGHAWGESCDALCAEGRFDLVICCDCLYIPSLHRPLVQTLAGCLAEAGVAFVCFSLHGNAPDEEVLGFFDAARERGFDADLFGERQLPPRCVNVAPKRSYVYAYTLRWRRGDGGAVVDPPLG